MSAELDPRLIRSLLCFAIGLGAGYAWSRSEREIKARIRNGGLCRTLKRHGKPYRCECERCRRRGEVCFRCSWCGEDLPLLASK